MKDKKDWELIMFPRIISASQLEVLLEHIGETFPARVQYTKETISIVGVERFMEGKERIKRKDQIQSIRGTIYLCSNNLYTLNFDVMCNYLLEPFKVRGLQFHSIPGYSYEENLKTFTCNPHIIEKVREITNYFFDKKSLNREVKGGEIYDK